MDRAYSLIDVKALDEEKRVFSGWATTPALDRVSDSINPMAVKFQNPLTLLHQHRHNEPIGTVTFKKPTEKGIEFTAEIPVVKESGPLKDRVDTAWGEVVHGLVRAVSIGFRATSDPKPNEKGGYDFDEVEVYELSTVSIPANSEALIHTIKSLDEAALQEAKPKEPIVEQEAKPAASGKAHRVVKLNDPARARAKPFVINKINTW